MNLRYSMMGASYGGTNGHPQKVMRGLGITYQASTPQSICDQWWFWNCENVPADLPGFLTELNITPREAIGNGLSAEEAESLMP